MSRINTHQQSPYPYRIERVIEEDYCSHPSCLILHQRYMNIRLESYISEEITDAHGVTHSVRTNKLHMVSKKVWKVIGADGFANGSYDTMSDAKSQLRYLNSIQRDRESRYASQCA